jgi:hypothetical protein
MLHLHANATTTDVRMILSDNTSTASGSRGFHIIKGNGNEAYIYNYENTQMVFGTNSTERMRISSNGNIGIGTNNPQATLHVNGDIRLSNSQITRIFSTNYGGVDQIKIASNGATCLVAHNGYLAVGNLTTAGYMLDVAVGYGGPGNINTSFIGYNTGVGNTTNNDYSMSISCRITGSIWVTSYFVTSSDIRIKEDIQDINDDNALQSILSIQPKTYKYVDKLEKGDKKVYGFIAQQIKEVIPEAVKIEKAYIPNIYSVADYNSNVITLPYQPTKVIIKVNDKIKCYDKDNKEILVEVIDAIDVLTFRIKDLEEEYYDTKIFVYGTFVDDFHTLNKDSIFTLNVCATQELHRRMEAQNIVIKSQDDRIKDLETKMERLLSGTT